MNLTTGTVKLKTGIQCFYRECGTGETTVLFVHGWPELGYSWREQMKAVAAAGYRAIAPDMRGFGGTDAPSDSNEYTQEKIIGDLVALLDHLNIPRVILVGHDWGGFVVWLMARKNPDRVQAVAGVNTPYTKRAPVPISQIMKANPGRFDYQVYFQDIDKASKEFDADVQRTFNILFRSSDPSDRISGVGNLGGTSTVTSRGGMLVGMPQDVPRSKMITEEELKVYVDKYTETGFRGGLNWYNFGVQDANWKWSEDVADKVIEQPSLMVTAGKDSVLTPAMAEGMEERCSNLTRGHIEECGHWTQQERPNELNEILLNWLTKHYPPTGKPCAL